MNEEETNLIDIYFTDGKFVPLTSNDGNVDETVANYRDTFMNAEKGYFIEILGEEKYIEVLNGLLNYTSDELFEAASNIMYAVESSTLGTDEEKKNMKFMKPEEREKYYLGLLTGAEVKLCLIFAAIRDKVKIKELSLGMQPAEESEKSIGGRTL